MNPSLSLLLLSLIFLLCHINISLSEDIVFGILQLPVYLQDISTEIGTTINFEYEITESSDYNYFEAIGKFCDLNNLNHENCHIIFGSVVQMLRSYISDDNNYINYKKNNNNKVTDDDMIKYKQLQFNILNKISLYYILQPNNYINSDFQRVVFQHDLRKMISLEQFVVIFCNTYNLPASAAIYIFDEALKDLRKLKEYNQIEEYISHNHLPNAKLTRRGAAYDSERISHFRHMLATGNTNVSSKNDDTFDYNEENRINDIIYHQFIEKYNEKSTYQGRVCFIHSCTFDSNNHVLIEILDNIVNSKLILKLDKIWVLNYGKLLPIDELEKIYPKLSIINRLTDMTRFEIPTLRHISALSKKLKSLNLATNGVGNTYDTQFLYLHTKGVSYSTDYQQVHDWRRYLLYWNIEQHEKIDYLLKSGEFDTIGTNYLSYELTRIYSGNMWWAMASYLAQLNPIKPTCGKYEGEMWLLSHPIETNVEPIPNPPLLRPYIIHQSGVDHYSQIYPSELYISNGTNINQVFDSDINCHNSDTNNINDHCLMNKKGLNATFCKNFVL